LLMSPLTLARASRWLTTLLLATNVCCASDTRPECSELTETFFAAPMKQRLQEFQEFTLEKKYAAYTCGLQAVHPRALYLVQPFAEAGSKDIQFLRGRLSATSDARTIRDIVRALTEMQLGGYYRITDDPSLMAMIAASIDRITTEQVKAQAIGMVSRLTDGQPPRRSPMDQ
jgi:hypothetical protein